MKKISWVLFTLIGIGLMIAEAYAGSSTGQASGIGGVAIQARKSLSGIAYLITAGSYVAGMGFGVGAIAKFKAHKDNPTQVPISMPIALLFVAAALIFIPSVYRSVGGTLYGASGIVGGVSGLTSFSR